MKARKWVGYDFNNRGWSTTHENRSDAFAQFIRDTRSDLKRMLKGTGWELKTGWKGNWFTTSGFLYNESLDRWVYISISDVRYWQDSWFERLLIRTAEHEKDYTGGRNQYCNFYDIPEQLERMFAYA
jgi:hypothetical protein